MILSASVLRGQRIYINVQAKLMRYFPILVRRHQPFPMSVSHPLLPLTPVGSPLRTD